MSDLISREKAIETLWSLFNSYGNNARVFDVEETEAINMFCSRLQSEIENQPTAYDVDKVVKELEDYQMWKGFMIYDLTHREREIIRKAIEIVKGGVVR